MESADKTLPEGCVSLEQAKKSPAPGVRFFVEKTGSIGIILEERAHNGKLLARMTCTKGGPDHIREISDWHQCGVSPEMKKKSKTKTKKEKILADEQLIAAEEKRRELEERLAVAKIVAGIS